MSIRTYQVSELIKQEVGIYIQSQLGRHKGLITIIAVETTPDLKNAKIWFGYVGSDVGTVTKELRSHRKDIQKNLNDRLEMKNVPKISFQLDVSGDYAQKISRIIDESLR